MNRRIGIFTASMVTLAAFGPYIFDGFRTEQLVVYSASILLGTTAAWVRIRPPSVAVVIVALMAIQLLLGIVGSISPPFAKYQPGSVQAGIDNLVLPMAVIFIVWTMLAAGAERLGLIRLVCYIVVWAMVLNTTLEMWASSGDGPNLAAFHGLIQLESVSDRAAQLGRYTGIFNQPAEAGFVYSIALIAAIYLYRNRSSVLAVVGTLLTVGGVLTVSKTFLFIGFPIGVWHAIRSSGGRQRRFAAFFLVVLAAWVAARSGLMPNWKGKAFLLELVPGARRGGSLDDYTAGRVGESSALSGAIDVVLQTSPLTGFGAGGLIVAYDAAWVEALVVNGIIGALIYTCMLVLLTIAWASARLSEGDAEQRLSGGLVIILIGASVGLPALTANRCSTIAWLLVTLLLLSRPGDASENPRLDLDLEIHH